MLDFDIWTIAFSIINILVLFLFLKKFLFGRIQNIMDQRATAVQADLDQAKASKEEAHQLRQQYEDTLSGAKQEASTIIANARTAAKEQGNDNLLYQRQRMHAVAGNPDLFALFQFAGKMHEVIC